MSEAADRLVPDPDVAEEFGVCRMTVWRWTQDVQLGFPPPIKIRRLNYRSRQALEAFKQRMVREAMQKHA